jgi:hypothetical protein
MKGGDGGKLFFKFFSNFFCGKNATLLNRFRAGRDWTSSYTDEGDKTGRHVTQ